jgi:hypothetical protein
VAPNYCIERYRGYSNLILSFLRNGLVWLIILNLAAGMSRSLNVGAHSNEIVSDDMVHFRGRNEMRQRRNEVHFAGPLGVLIGAAGWPGWLLD